MKTKICTRCKKRLPLTEFYKHKKNPDGHAYVCKECQRIQSRKYYHEHKKEYSDCHSRYYQEHKEERKRYSSNYYYEHREEKKEYQRNYQKENPEKNRKHNQKYREEHREEYNEYHRIYYHTHPKCREQIYRWRKNNPDKVKYYVEKRRERLKNIESCYTKEDLEEKLNSTNGICQMCGEYVGIENLTLEHILPISKAPKGFVYTIDDIQFLCRSCNSKKRDKLLLYCFM